MNTFISFFRICVNLFGFINEYTLLNIVGFLYSRVDIMLCICYSVKPSLHLYVISTSVPLQLVAGITSELQETEHRIIRRQHLMIMI